MMEKVFIWYLYILIVTQIQGDFLNSNSYPTSRIFFIYNKMANKRELSFVDQPHPKRPNSSLGLRSDSVKAFGQIPIGY